MKMMIMIISLDVRRFYSGMRGVLQAELDEFDQLEREHLEIHNNGLVALQRREFLLAHVQVEQEVRVALVRDLGTGK